MRRSSGTLRRVHHRPELDQHAVACGLDDPPAMLGQERFCGCATLAQRARGAGLVGLHQP